MAHLYVVQGTGDLIKVGRTINFDSRIVALRQQLRKYGSEVASSKFFEVPDDDADVIERRLINKLVGVFEQYAGREWFIGSFEDACSAAEIAITEAVFRQKYPQYEFDHKQLAKQHEDRRLREEVAREARRLWLIEHEKQKVAREERRQLRRIEVAARMGFAPIEMPIVSVKRQSKVINHIVAQLARAEP